VRQKTAGGERTLHVQQISRDEIGAVVEGGVQDVAGALAYLAEQGIAVDRVALVGCSYGSTVSLLTTQTEKSVRAVALLVAHPELASKIADFLAAAVTAK